jgi:hypothetical protein
MGGIFPRRRRDGDGCGNAAVPFDRQQRRLRRGPKRINVAVEDSLLFDSSMLLIKASSEGAGVHNNSCGLFIIFNQPSLSVFRSHSVSALPNVESEVSQGQE